MTLTVAASSLAALLVVIVVGVLAPSLLGLRDGGLILATALVAAGIISFEVSGGMLLGLDRRPAYLAQQILEGLGSLVVTAIALLLVAPTATGMVAPAAIAYLVAAVVSIVIAHRTVGGPWLGFDLGYTRDALGMGLRGQIGNILNFLNLRLDLLLVPWLVDLGAAGIYLVVLRMSEAVTQIASAAAALLFPAVTRADVRQTALTERTVRGTLLVVVTAGIAIAILAPWLLGVFFGAAFESGTTTLRITMLAMLPLSVVRLITGDLKGRGRAGLTSIAAGAALVVTVVLDLLLIPAFGIEGAAVASLVAYSVGAAILLVAYRRVTSGRLRALVPTIGDARMLLSAGMGVVRRARPAP